jgi:hypothetical protein
MMSGRELPVNQLFRMGSPAVFYGNWAARIGVLREIV